VREGSNPPFFLCSSSIIKYENEIDHCLVYLKW